MNIGGCRAKLTKKTKQVLTFKYLSASLTTLEIVIHECMGLKCLIYQHCVV